MMSDVQGRYERCAGKPAPIHVSPLVPPDLDPPDPVLTPAVPVSTAIAPGAATAASVPHDLRQILKRIPAPAAVSLYPAVLILTALAIAEQYGLIASGAITGMARTAERVMVSIARTGQALNTRYPGLLPDHWLASMQTWQEQEDRHGLSAQELQEKDVQKGDAALRAIAQVLIPAIADLSLDATWLGTLHEELLDGIAGDQPGLAEPSAASPHSPIPSPTRTKPTDAPGSRKGQGAYYTPPAVVDYMIRQTLYPALNREFLQPCHPRLSGLPEELRVLDPACGGGVFLVAAYRVLLEVWADRMGRSLALAEREFVLQSSIFGVDVDPHAVTVTRLALQLEYLRRDASVPLALDGQSGTAAASLAANIQPGNALLATEPDGLVWDEAFPAVMDAGGFDVVIGNPPYLDSERMADWFPHWRHACVKQYASAQGNWDLFCVFIEKALMLCKPGGYHSFIVPNALAIAPYATAVRSLLTREGILLSIRDYSRSQVFSASVYPLVYVVQRRSPAPLKATAASAPPADPLVRYDRMGRTSDPGSKTTWLPPPYFASPQAGWLLGDRPHDTDWVLRLRQCCSPLGTLAHVHGAATVSEAYRLQPFIHEHSQAIRQATMTQDTVTHDTVTHDTGTHDTVQLINSGTIDPYQSLWGRKPLRYLGKRYENPVVSKDDLACHFPRRFQQAIAPKIIVAGMTRRLECVADAAGTLLAGKSTAIVMPHHLPLLYVLGILNSQPMQRIVMECLGSHRLRGGYLRIGPPQLRMLPIPLPRDGLGDRLVCQVEDMMEWGRSLDTRICPEEAIAIRHRIQETNQHINQIVQELYDLVAQDAEA